jgi:hypothetical protein
MRSGPAVLGASHCAASSETAAVLRAVTAAHPAQAPHARSHVEHHDIALDRRPSGARVGGREGDQLGDGDLRVAGRHDEQAATAGQGLHQAGWHLHDRIAQDAHQLLHQGGVGQAGRRGGGIRQIVHREEVGNCSVRILSYSKLRRSRWRSLRSQA